jgi:hypothetical protein
MNSFYVTRRDPRTGQRFEVPLDFPSNTPPTPPGKDEATRLFNDALPGLLHSVDLAIVGLQAKLETAGDMNRSALQKELKRWERRRGFLAEGRITCSPRDGMDLSWTVLRDRHLANARIAGLLVTEDEEQPSGKSTVQATPPPSTTQAIQGLVPALRRLAKDIKRQASLRAEGDGGALGKQAQAVEDAAMVATRGYVVSSPAVDRVRGYIDIVVPLYSAARAAGLLKSYSAVELRGVADALSKQTQRVV